MEPQSIFFKRQIALQLITSGLNLVTCFTATPIFQRPCNSHFFVWRGLGDWGGWDGGLKVL